VYNVQYRVQVSSEPRASLSQERILAAAGAVVAEEGQAGLSMRRLAERLDVWPMAVYRYFRDKDELLDALAADAAKRVGRTDAGGPWDDRLKTLLADAHAAIQDDPEGLGARMPQAFLSTGWLRVSESGIALLREGGFSAADAAAAWRALWSYTYGSAVFRIAPTQGESVRAARVALAALPEDEYPVLAAAGREFPDSLAAPDAFARGLDALLAGLASR